MPDHPDDLARSAELAWADHVAGCAQCAAAAGPPPPDVKPEDRVLYACEVGMELHERAVLAAQAIREEFSGRG